MCPRAQYSPIFTSRCLVPPHEAMIPWAGPYLQRADESVTTRDRSSRSFRAAHVATSLYLTVPTIMASRSIGDPQRVPRQPEIAGDENRDNGEESSSWRRSVIETRSDQYRPRAHREGPDVLTTSSVQWIEVPAMGAAKTARRIGLRTLAYVSRSVAGSALAQQIRPPSSSCSTFAGDGVEKPVKALPSVTSPDGYTLAAKAREPVLPRRQHMLADFAEPGVSLHLG